MNYSKSNFINEKMFHKKKNILEKSLRLFALQGYHETTVRDIINSSGYGTSTFYRYFSNKEEVLTTLLKNFLEQVVGSVREYYNQEENLYIRFIQTKKIIMEIFAQNPELAEIYCRVVGISQEIDDCLKEFDNAFVAFSNKNIKYGIKQGIFKNISVEPISLAILGLIKFVVYKWTVTKEINKEDMIKTVLSFHETLAKGLVKEKEQISSQE